MNRRKIVLAGDLFSGAGGLSLGAEMAGAKVIFASDSWGAAAATYTANHHSTDFFECPIKDLDGRAVMRRTGIRKGEQLLGLVDDEQVGPGLDGGRHVGGAGHCGPPRGRPWQRAA